MNAPVIKEQQEEELKHVIAMITAYCDSHTGKSRQDAYIESAEIKKRVDAFVASEDALVQTHLNRNLQLHYNNSKFTREGLEGVARVGHMEGDGKSGSNYGGLLGAVLVATEEHGLSEFRGYAALKINGAVIDYTRKVLGRFVANPDESAVRFSTMDENGAGSHSKFNKESSFETDHDYRSERNVGFLHDVDPSVLLLAAKTLSPADQALVVPFVEAIGDHDVTRAAGMLHGAAPKLEGSIEPALTRLKFAYLQLPDDILPDAITDLKFGLLTMSDKELLSDRVLHLMHVFNIKMHELGKAVDLHESRISQRFTANNISGEMLAALGITEEHLSEYKRQAFPECWTKRHRDSILEKLEKRDTAKSFSIALKDLLKWAGHHRREDVTKLCGEHYSQTQKCINRLNRFSWPANNKEDIHPTLEEYHQLNNMLAAAGIARRQLPPFIQVKLASMSIAEIELPLKKELVELAAGAAVLPAANVSSVPDVATPAAPKVSEVAAPVETIASEGAAPVKPKVLAIVAPVETKAPEGTAPVEPNVQAIVAPVETKAPEGTALVPVKLPMNDHHVVAGNHRVLDMLSITPVKRPLPLAKKNVVCKPTQESTVYGHLLAVRLSEMGVGFERLVGYLAENISQMRKTMPQLKTMQEQRISESLVRNIIQGKHIPSKPLHEALAFICKARAELQEPALAFDAKEFDAAYARAVKSMTGDETTGRVQHHKHAYISV